MKKVNLENTFFNPKNSYERFGIKIYNALVENFSETYFVGGMVRNIFWNERVNDVDIATIATPKQVAKVLSSLQLKLDLTGERFGVVIASEHKHEVQITTFRTESYNNNRYPKISYSKSWQQDAKRRDFTINSLYFQAKLNVLFDPNGCLTDLERRVLKSVGKPAQKFKEDPLRIVRAHRFEQQFNLRVDTETREAMNNLESLTRTLTKSKVKTEIDKATNVKVKNFLTKKFL